MKSNYPLVSIIIITSNSEDTITKCLSSLFNVNYPREKFEVIIIDAGSTDRTIEMVKNFPVDKILVKKGVRGKARNIGVQEAKGEIVAMVDSDLSSPNNDWLVNAVKEFKDPRIALVRGRDLVLLPKKSMNFFQRAIYFMSITPSRILLNEEDWNGK